MCVWKLRKLWHVCGVSERVGRALWRRLLERAAPGGDLGQPGHYVTGSSVHRSRVRAWQALAVISKFAPADEIQNTFRTIWSSVQVPFYCQQTFSKRWFMFETFCE